MLDEARKEVFLRTGEDGHMHVSGAAELEVLSPEMLNEAMQAALGRRETASTGANATSSRSHAVCMLRIGEGAGRGVLTLVDLGTP